jgi:hypothetical protein
MLIIEQDGGRILGQTVDVGYARDGRILIPEPEGFVLALADEWNWDGSTLIHDLVAAMVRIKGARIAEVKRQAKAAIEALAWRVERARERAVLGLPGETESAVLIEREAIRRASNRVEAAINACLDASSVRDAPFAVTGADKVM